MKVVILTSKPYWEFLTDSTKTAYRDGHDLWMSEATTFPNEYDVGISFMHLGKVPAKEVNTHLWFNFHPGPLPEYKGRNLCYHAIMNGETDFGATLHYMDEDFDTGPIIDVWRFHIEHGATAHDVHRWTMETAKAMFQEYFPQILEGFPFSVVPNVGGKYYKKEPIEEFVSDFYEVDIEYVKREIRAIYFPPHYPKIKIDGVDYKIVRDE